MDAILAGEARKGHPFEILDKLPTCILKRQLRKKTYAQMNRMTPEYRADYGKPCLNDEGLLAYSNYIETMH